MQEPIELLTNNAKWSAETVAALYKARRDIEIFFKTIKQLLGSRSEKTEKGDWIVTVEEAHLPLYRQIKELERLGIEGLSEGVMGSVPQPMPWSHWERQCTGCCWKARCRTRTKQRCRKASVTKGSMGARPEADDGKSPYHGRTNRRRHVLDERRREVMNPEGAVYGGTIIGDGYEGCACAVCRRSNARSGKPAGHM